MEASEAGRLEPGGLAKFVACRPPAAVFDGSLRMDFDVVDDAGDTPALLAKEVLEAVLEIRSLADLVIFGPIGVRRGVEVVANDLEVVAVSGIGRQL
jgi:hypothetical protein